MHIDTTQSIIAVLICMAGICFIFMNNLPTVVMASGCVLSICTGILGLLSWWSIDLDPITMAAMIISIGFSVDIPAHVSYHYHQAAIQVGKLAASTHDKLTYCLSAVAFPALQAALSSILCVCSLAFAEIYLAEVFFKTMLLCIVLCNLHGLVFLPAFIVIYEWLVDLVRCSRKKNTEVKQDFHCNIVVACQHNEKLNSILKKKNANQEVQAKNVCLMNI
uniref:Uncharacterized protein n=1 Tax=Acrobeloides nanus TaxID=290746 RepID=A0A914CS40_9BILA